MTTAIKRRKTAEVTGVTDSINISLAEFINQVNNGSLRQILLGFPPERSLTQNLRWFLLNHNLRIIEEWKSRGFSKEAVQEMSALLRLPVTH